MTHYYRAMHYSAKRGLLRLHVVRPSVYDVGGSGARANSAKLRENVNLEQFKVIQGR